ncbi:MULTISPECIES: pyridoxal phosphate-dependent aminotransferase [unclassified Francisella]|uniref:pyridoxal phosphate-dependent aminotransferase n=1 Tax=unclassified Francisella TaxID=2610885 RepID=UPI002E316FFC|nr:MULTISPECIES: pyridoxal phosphate-dependent aminotransferase [unclassified Francisella]MED7820358.1 pyridoxal phosphate-dependent aminotransferase [Francisella sp. 19S2-4]MED7831189.1 pyridoxal phosphate-dependent aminotransferase [Francisella sp. 19S2-10]
MTIQISNRVTNIKPSATALMSSKVQELVDEGKNILSLNVGEPGFHTPDVVKKAGIEAIQNNYTQYTTVDGYKDLRQAIVNRYSSDYGINYKLNEVCVTTGAKHSLHNIFNCIINHGNEVIYMAPYWASYPDMIKLSGGIPVVLETSIDNGFEPDILSLESLISSKTKAILINIPNNPSGAVYSESTIRALADLMKKYHHVVLISDEVYDQIYWDRKPITVTNIYPELKDRLIVASGVSKNYAMTGWRVGHILAPAEFINAIKKFQSQSLSCACSISQIAAIEALKLERADIEYMNQEYYESVYFVFNTLKDIPDVKVFMPQGGFYIFLDISKILNKMGLTDEDFCLKLLEETLVGVIHGSAFGLAGHIRISATAERNVLQEAIKRLKNFILLH